MFAKEQILAKVIKRKVILTKHRLVQGDQLVLNVGKLTVALRPYSELNTAQGMDDREPHS